MYRWEGASERDDRIRRVSREASALYSGIAEKLREMRGMFPFPGGGEPNSPVQAERSIVILQSVKAMEEKAVALLADMHAIVI